MLSVNNQEIRKNHEEIREIKERFNILEIISGIGKSSLTADRGVGETLMQDLWNRYAEGNGDSGGTLCRLGALLDLDPTTLLNPSNREELLLSMHDSARKLMYEKNIERGPNQEYLDYLKKSFDLFAKSDSSSAKQICENYNINRERYVGLDDKNKLTYILGESQYLTVKGALFDQNLIDLQSFDDVKTVIGLYSGEKKILLTEYSLIAQLLLVRKNLELLSQEKSDESILALLEDDQYKLISEVFSKWQYFTKRDRFMDGDKFLPKKPLGMDHGTNGVVINRLIAYGLILDFNFIPSVDKNMAELDTTHKRIVLTLNLMKMLNSEDVSSEINVGAIRVVLSSNKDLYDDCLSNTNPYSTSIPEEEIIEDLSRTQNVFINQIIEGDRPDSETWRTKTLAGNPIAK